MIFQHYATHKRIFIIGNRYDPSTVSLTALRKGYGSCVYTSTYFLVLHHTYDYDVGLFQYLHDQSTINIALDYYKNNRCFFIMYHANFPYAKLTDRFNDHIFVTSQFPNYRNWMDFEKELPLRFHRFLENNKRLKRKVIGLILVSDEEEANDLYKNFQWELRGITTKGVYYDKYVTQKTYTLLLVTRAGTKIIKYGQKIWVQLFGSVLHFCSDVKYYNDVQPFDIVVGQNETLRTALPGCEKFCEGDLGSIFRNIIYTNFTSVFSDEEWDAYFRNQMPKSGRRHYVKVDVEFAYDGLKDRITFEGPNQSTRLFQTLTVENDRDMIKYSGCYRAYIVTNPCLIPVQDNIADIIPYEPVVTGTTYTEIENKIKKLCSESYSLKESNRQSDPYLLLKQLKISHELLNVLVSDFSTSFKAVSLNDLSTDTGNFIEFPKLHDSPGTSRFQFTKGRILRRRAAVMFMSDILTATKIRGRMARTFEKDSDGMMDRIKTNKLLYQPSFHASTQDLMLKRKDTLRAPCIFDGQEPKIDVRSEQRLSSMLQAITSIILPAETESWDED